MRTELKVNFKCSDCGSLLEIPLKDENSKGLGCTWAGDAIMNIIVEPCRFCIEKQTKDARQFAQTLKNLIEL